MKERSILFATTSLLEIAYEDSGPADGKPIFLIHGWPDDARTWDRQLPVLHQSGWRTIAPYLRGFGSTRFRDQSTFRSGEMVALVQDIIELAQSLDIEKFAVIGHDWGARIAYNLGALYPEKVTQIVALSIPLNRDNPAEIPLIQVHSYWYQWFFSTALAEARLKNDGPAFIGYILKLWANKLSEPEEEFKDTMVSFLNQDWIEITLHSYRVRWGLAVPDIQYQELQKRLKADPVIKVRTLSIRGKSDPIHAPSLYPGDRSLCSDGFQFVQINNSGHFPQRENAQEVNEALLNFLR